MQNKFIRIAIILKIPQIAFAKKSFFFIKTVNIGLVLMYIVNNNYRYHVKVKVYTNVNFIVLNSTVS